MQVLRVVVNFDHLYLGGGNAKKIAFDLPEDVTIVSNSDGLTGGIALWRAEEATSPAPTPAPEPPLAKPHRTAAEAVAKKARSAPPRRNSKPETPLPPH